MTTRATANEERHCSHLRMMLPNDILVAHLGGSRSDVADIALSFPGTGRKTFCESKPGTRARCGQATYRASGKASIGMRSMEWDDAGLPVPYLRNAYTDAISTILAAHKDVAPGTKVIALSETEEIEVAKAIANHYRNDLSCPYMIVGQSNANDVLMEMTADNLRRVLSLGIEMPYGKKSGSRPLGMDDGPTVADAFARHGIPHGTVRFRRNLPVSRRNKSGLVIPVTAADSLGWPRPQRWQSVRVSLDGEDYILSDTGGSVGFIELRKAGTVNSITAHVTCWMRRIGQDDRTELSDAAIGSILNTLGASAS